ncbi:hypothetical protein GCM10009733_020140 [Nonomuraea maheshkhaliensis]|uniref:TniQ protein n=1 Tax=Nonomuraea maheshkhaliensis TaxID=419590 RepID=A0ABP4QXU3_9ACTN
MRRLPIAVRPAHQETLSSYVARLADVHGMPYKELWRCLSKRIRPTLPRRLLVAERLTALTGYPLPALQRALPELRDPPPDWSQLRHLAQWACPLCTARHPGGRVQCLFAHHEFLCTDHGYWFGPAEKVGKGTVEPLGAVPHPRRLTNHIPELPDAQRRHQRLVHRHGWLRCFNGFEASLNLCAHIRPHGPPDPDNPWTARLERLIRIERLGIRFKAFDGWLFIAAIYPEAVHLTELFFSPAGRQLAEKTLSSGDGHAMALAPLSRALGHAGQGSFDSISINAWLRGALGTERLRPRLTFPETRDRTVDGTPTERLDSHQLDRQREARRDFRKHQHPGSWRLPNNFTRENGSMIDREHAVRLIEELLRADRETVDRHGQVIPLAITRVTEHRLGWIVSYQSQAYLRSGSTSDLLAGNGPYLVDRHDGSIHLIPVTDYVAGLWEEDYEQRIKLIGSVENDPHSDIPFATEVREALADGRIAAIRLLRRCAPGLNMVQASDYVAAVGSGKRPAAELIELARPPEPFTGRLGIMTITGPLLSATDLPGPGSVTQ